MKKLLCVVLLCLVSLNLFSACGNKNEVSDKNISQSQSESTKVSDNQEEGKETAKKPVDDYPAPSKNKEVVSSDTAPEVHIIEDGADKNARICYHLSDCKTLKGTTHKVASWELVETVQFRQCPECNPPRYKNYVE